MTPDPVSNHHRRSIRLKGFDYTSEGGYFITLVTYERHNFFGEIINDEMLLNPLGEIARNEWFRTATLRPYVDLFDDEFIIMPNHIHGILWLSQDVAAYCTTPLQPNVSQFRSPRVGVGAIIRGYKSSVTKRVKLLFNTSSSPLWQRNYYEHIITTDGEYDAIVEYIHANPLNWALDQENLDRF